MIYRAKYVLPMDGRVIENGEVLVRDGRIEAVYAGPENNHAGEPVTDLGACALLPGFVNAHSHLEPTMKRNCMDGLNLWDWLSGLGFRKDSSPDYELLRASAVLGASECARSGITCLGECSFSGAAVSAIEAVGLRGVVYRELFGQSMGTEYLARFNQVLDDVQNVQSGASGRLKIGISPHSIYTSNREVLKLCAETCTTLHIPVALHLAETMAESEYSLYGTGPVADMRHGFGYEPMVSGLAPVAYLEEVGLIREGVCLAHCVCVSEEEIKMIAAGGAGVAHCPRSNAFLGAGIAPLKDFTSAGVPVGLGTDSAASCMNMDFFEEMRFAIGLARAKAKEASIMMAKDVLALATTGGAKALGLLREVGSIEARKRADIIAVDVGDALPDEDVYLSVVSRSPSDVRLVLVDGVEVLRDGHLTKVDIAERRADLVRMLEKQ